MLPTPNPTNETIDQPSPLSPPGQLELPPGNVTTHSSSSFSSNTNTPTSQQYSSNGETSRSTDSPPNNREPHIHSQPHTPVTPLDIPSTPSDNLPSIMIPEGETITRQALGRVAQIGQLYNAHRDEFCAGRLYSDLPSHTIQIVDKNHIDYQYIYTNSLAEKYRQLNIEPELKASCLAGLVKADGHGKYLNIKSESARETSATLVCKMTTKHESIEINHHDAVKFISPNNVVGAVKATHVVTAIQWGAAATLELEKIAKISVNGGEGGAYEKNASNISRNFHLTFTIDALPYCDEMPDNVEKATKFISRIPNLMQKQNEGKGTQICYTLTPLSAFKHYLGAIDSLNQKIATISEDAIDRAMHIFDEMNRSECRLKDIHEDFLQYSYCLSNEVVSTVFDRIQAVCSRQVKMRDDLQSTIVSIRDGVFSIANLREVIHNYENDDKASRSEVDKFIESLRLFFERINTAKMIKDKGALYIGRGDMIKTEREKKDISECYVFFCSWQDSKLLSENMEYFLRLLKSHNNTLPCFFVDVDIQPENRISEGVPDGNRICKYKDGIYLYNDCYSEYLKDKQKCLAKCPESSLNRRLEVTNKRINVSLKCPLSKMGKYCSHELHEWYCAECLDRLEFDFKGNFRCQCGSAPIYAYKFRCSHKNHGHDYYNFDEADLIEQVNKIREKCEINILILGESGVGKSTWINSFANYLIYEELKEAEKGNQIYLVPSRFTYTDDYFEERTISIGDSPTENNTVGASATLEPRAYVFNAGERIIRLIDTPGIGDTGGANADDNNFASILHYISNFNVLHGICILLKPNNSRLNVMFRYCINELLTRLDVSAANNIVFCFTNSRGTFYRPGDTMPVLRTFLEQLKRQTNNSVDIQTNEHTVYCMDNESFRFLCILHDNNNSNFTEDTKKNYEASWTKSRNETFRMIEHFESGVTPHAVRNIVSLNEARTIILTLAKPLAEISQNIQDNIAVISEKKEKLKRINIKHEDLKKDLLIPTVEIKLIKLDKPRTVCTNSKCVDYQRSADSGITMTIYKTHCHNPCRLTDVIAEQFPNENIKKCICINKETYDCNDCGCNWSVHMHILYDQKKVDSFAEDPNVREAMNQNLSDREVQEAFIRSSEDRIKKFEQEQKRIDEICARFGAFLKEHAILAYNDAIEDYLKFNIKEVERELANTNDPDKRITLDHLNNKLGQYREARDLLKERMISGKVSHIRSEDIWRMQEELENLELSGPKIKELFDASIKAKYDNLIFTEKYFESPQRRRHILRHLTQSIVFDESWNQVPNGRSIPRKDHIRPRLS